MHERFEGRLVRERPNEVLSGLRYAFIAGSFALIPVLYLQLLSDRLLAWIGPGWFLCCLVSLPVMRRFARRARRSAVDVQIDSDGIHVDGKLVMRREQIRSGAMHTVTDGEIRVVFHYRRSLEQSFGKAPLLAFLAADTAHARAMLAAAGVDAERQVFRATFLRPQAAWQVVLALFVYVALSALGGAMISWRLFGFIYSPVVAVAPVLLAGLIAFGVYMLIARTTVSVGTDGIEVRRAFRNRFLRLDQIRDVKVEPKALKIVLAGGEMISLVRAVPMEPIGHLGVSDIGMERALLGDRIVDAVRAHKARRLDGAGAVALGRDARSADEWLASLRALGMGATDYRTGVLPVEELRRVVGDATAASDVRVGAAVALRVAEGAIGVERIRVAADTTAAPELRGVLKDIADEIDEDNLQRHLSRVR